MMTGTERNPDMEADLAKYLLELSEGAVYLCDAARDKLREAAEVLGQRSTAGGFIAELQHLLRKHSLTLRDVVELSSEELGSERASANGTFGLSEARKKALLENSLKPEEIDGTPAEQHDRVVELLTWFARLAEGSGVNPKWLQAHACELAYYIASNGMNAHINLEDVRKAAFLEGLRVSPSERGILERLGAGVEAGEEPAIDADSLNELVPEPAMVRESTAYFTLGQLHDVVWAVAARARSRRGGMPFAYWMKGTTFPHFVCYPASHKPTDVNNFEPLYRDQVAPKKPAHWYHARHLLAIAISTFASRVVDGKSVDESAASDLLDALTNRGGPLMWLPEQLELRMAA